MTYCKFESALEIFVGKWKPVILLRLFSNGTMRFSELQRAIPEITKKCSHNNCVSWNTTILSTVRFTTRSRRRWSIPSRNMDEAYQALCRP